MDISKGEAAELGSVIKINSKKRTFCHSDCPQLKATKPSDNLKFGCIMFGESNEDEAILEKQPMHRRKGCIEANGTT